MIKKIMKFKCTKCGREVKHEVIMPSLEEGYFDFLLTGNLPVYKVKCLECGHTELIE
jgi:uncharacterized Zn finger protein